MDIRRNLGKSLLYRVITIGFGLLTALIVTGDVFTAFLVSLLTEIVQFFWYFSFDTVWTYYDEKRLRKLIKEEYRQKEIKLKLSLESIKDLAREFSQVDTFIPKLYNSVISFYNRILMNKELKELHQDFLEYKNAFEAIHRGRKLAETKDIKVGEK